MCLAGARRTISRGREREREGAVDSIDLPSVLRRWKCVLNVVGTESRERERERERLFLLGEASTRADSP